MTTCFRSFAEVQGEAPRELAEHVHNSKQLRRQGFLLMAGAFLDRPNAPLCTMGVFTSYEEARRYAETDPFVLAGLVEGWFIREWGNIFR